MSGFVIDFHAERNARIEEANLANARRQLEAAAGMAVTHLIAGLPGAAEAQAIMDKAFAERLPEELTEESILRQMENNNAGTAHGEQPIPNRKAGDASFGFDSPSLLQSHEESEG